MLVEIHKFESTDDLKSLCCLGPGKHTLGRGPALQCGDKRVSRSHVQIDISEASATITAKHEINPCFFRPCESNSISLLKFNCPTELTNGDTFGFFPDQYWFSVKITTVGNDAVVPTATTDRCQRIKNRDMLPTVCDREVLPTTSGNIQAVLPTGASSNLNNSSDITDQVLPTVAETINQGSRTVSATTGILPTGSEVTDEMLPTASEIANGMLPTVAEISNEMLPTASEITNGMLPTASEITNELLPTAREITNEMLSTASDITNEMLPTASELTNGMLPTFGEMRDEMLPTVGEIRDEMLPTVGEIRDEMLPTVDDSNTSEGLPTDGEVTSQEMLTVTNQVMLTIDDAGMPIMQITLEACSNEEEATCETMTAVKIDKPDSPVADKPEKKVVRDRCWYGDKCFRRHADHKAEFSHPGDADYDTDPKDPRPSCSYGDQCYRRNGQHRKDFKHPKGAHAKKPPRHHQPQQKRKLSDKSNSDDDDPAKVAVGNITNQKRLRKKVAKQKQDTPEDDYDLEDPFIDDSDDEYQFESFDSDSDYDD